MLKESDYQMSYAALELLLGGNAVLQALYVRQAVNRGGAPE